MTQARPTKPAQAHDRLTAPGEPFEMAEALIRGVPTRVWKNVPPTLRDVFEMSQCFPAREMLVLEGDRVTYSGFGKAVARLAEDFARRGLRQGDRVALVMRNRCEWPLIFFAAVLSGAIITPLNSGLARLELVTLLDDCGAKIAVLDEAVCELLAPVLGQCSSLAAIYVAGSGAHAGVCQLTDVVGPVSAWDQGEAPPLPLVTLAPDDDAAIFYTSGTTGLPKGAVLSHRNIITAIRTNGVAQARALLMAGKTYAEADPQAVNQTTTLLVFNLSHVAACCNSLIPLMVRGGRIVLIGFWSAEGAMRLIQRERINAISGAPTMALQLLSHPKRGDYDLSSLRYVLFGGAPASGRLSQEVGDTLRATPFCGYGMTETAASFTNLVAGEYLAHPESCGPAAPVGEIRIMSLDGDEVLAPGEAGEIWLKGPQVARGYWMRPQETEETFQEGWVRTGDIGRLDGEGYLTIVDRAKDVIIRGGENIYSLEVEMVLKSHPAVADAALVGVPHPTFGEEPVAVVVVREGQTAEERDLRAHVRERLAAFKTPVRVLLTDQALPRNEGGKALKALVRAMVG